MSEVKLCASCNKPLTGYRSHAVTCGSTCRGVLWRAKKEIMVSIKLMFNLTNYTLITKAAESHGVPISQFIHDRAIKTMECSQC